MRTRESGATVTAERFTTGRLARAAGVPRSTILYYERQRLIRAEGRSLGNYRLYGPAALKRLRFIRAAQTLGFSLSEIRDLAGRHNGPAMSAGRLKAALRSRLARLETEIVHLGRTRERLRRALRLAALPRSRNACPVTEVLIRATAPGLAAPGE